MKVLHIIDSGGLYGAEMMLVSLVSAQLQTGTQAVIGSIRTPGLPEKPIEQEARLRGIDVQEFPMQPGVNLAGARRILQYIRHGQFDLIHSHGYKTNILLGFLPSWIRKVPIITTLHGWTNTGGWTKMRLNEELDALSLRFVNRIVLVNRGMLDRKKVKNLPQSKLSVINNGIEIDFAGIGFPENGCTKKMYEKILQLHNRGTVIASIGRLSPEKGFSDLIEAVRLLRQEHNERITLLLIGAGRLHSELQEQADTAGLKDAFLITGYIKNARSLLKFIDIYVISSLTEGLPITLLEAMAANTPVVATAVGGIPYVVENRKDALLVTPQNAGCLAKAIKELLHNNKLRKSLRKQALLKVNKKYSSAIMAEKYLAVYNKILKNPLR
jgi:glycosyltransferase involved in cell wall biosynthesis